MASILIDVKHAPILNVIAGYLLFVLGAFIIRYYFLAHLGKIHGKLANTNVVLRGAVQGLLALVPMLGVLPSMLTCHENLHIAASFSLLNNVLLFPAIILISTKRFKFNLKLYNGLALSMGAFILLVPIAMWSKAGAVAALGLSSLAVLGSLFIFSGIHFQTIQENGYPRSFNLNYYFFYFKNLLYPFEIFLDYALIIHTKKNKSHLFSLPYRALISPYITLVFGMLCYTAPISTTAMLLLSSGVFFAALILFYCAQKQRFFTVVTLYSMAACCFYIYAIIYAQCRISYSFSISLGTDFSKTAIIYLVPQLVYYGLIVHSHFLNIGLRYAVIYATLISQAIVAFCLFLLAVYIGFQNSTYSLLADTTAAISLIMSEVSLLTFVAYANFFKGRIPRDLVYISLFYAITYYCVL